MLAIYQVCMSKANLHELSDALQVYRSADLADYAIFMRNAVHLCTHGIKGKLQLATKKSFSLTYS